MFSCFNNIRSFEREKFEVRCNVPKTSGSSFYFVLGLQAFKPISFIPSRTKLIGRQTLVPQVKHPSTHKAENCLTPAGLKLTAMTDLVISNQHPNHSAMEAIILVEYGSKAMISVLHIKLLIL